MGELAGLGQGIIDALKSQPRSVDTLAAILEGHTESEVRDAVRTLKARRLVTEHHVLTNPPKTLYGRADN